MKKEPEEAQSSWLWGRLGSFLDAFCGLLLVTGAQANAQIHAVATLLVVVAGFAFGLAALEWALIVFAITLVWTAEGLNTAIELAVDLASPEPRSIAGKAKDAAAGAVLAAAIGATIIGACIFGPKIVALFR